MLNEQGANTAWTHYWKDSTHSVDMLMDKMGQHVVRFQCAIQNNMRFSKSKIFVSVLLPLYFLGTAIHEKLKPWKMELKIRMDASLLICCYKLDVDNKSES